MPGGLEPVAGLSALRPGGGAGMTSLRVASPEVRPFFTPKRLAVYLSISERTTAGRLRLTYRITASTLHHAE